MAVNAQSILLRRLTQAGLIDAARLSKLLAEKNSQYQTVADLLISEKLITAQALAQAAGAFTMHSVLDLDYFDADFIPEQEKNEKLVRKHHVLPIFKRHRTLFLAVVDPTDMQPVEDFEFSTGLHAELVVVEFDKLHKLIDKVFDHKAGDSFSETDWDLSALGLTDKEDEDGIGAEAEDQPIITFINKMLHDAIRKGASDLHFEPYEKSYRIRFRIDGILHEVASPPVALSSRLSARLKVMSRLDIARKTRTTGWPDQTEVIAEKIHRFSRQ